jgi:hypothetical protein
MRHGLTETARGPLRHQGAVIATKAFPDLFFNKATLKKELTMRTKLAVATALAGTLLATCLVSGSAQATSVPVLKSDASMVTLVRKGGGGGHGGFKGHGGGFKGGHIGRGGGGRHYAYRGGGRHYAYRGGGRHYAYRGGGRHYAYRGGGRHYAYRGGGRHYAYRGRGHGYYDRYRRYGHYGRYRHYGWYGLPYVAYGYYGGGCGWLYRNAVATGSAYWWNRYYACTGYYY